MPSLAIVIFVVSAIATAVIVQQRRERAWRRQFLASRQEIGDAELLRLFDERIATDATVLRVLRFIGARLHVPAGLLRPKDLLTSFKAPVWAVTDDLWALDDGLLEAQLAERALAREVQTIDDVIELVVSAEAKIGREIV